MNRLLRRGPFRLQYASNLFAYRDTKRPETMLKPAVAPYLALLGNVVSTDTATARWNSQEFLSFCADNWKQTFLVPATTELGSTSKTLWTDALDDLRALVNSVNSASSSGTVYIADQNEFKTLEGIRLLGFTGWNAWSRSAAQPPALGFPTLYSYQGCGPNTTSLVDTVRGHEHSKEDMEWLNSELISDASSPTVLLSHGLSSSSLVSTNLPQAAYHQSDLMTFYPFPFLFSRERCIKACLSGSGLAGTVSGIIGGRFHAVNAGRPYPTAPPSPTYRPDAVYEYSWRDDAEGGVRELVEEYARVIPLPYRGIRPTNAPSVC